MSNWSIRTCLILMGFCLSGLGFCQELPSSVDLRPFLYTPKEQMNRGASALYAGIGALEFFPGVPCLSDSYAYSAWKAYSQAQSADLNEVKRFLETTPLPEDKAKQAKALRASAIYRARGIHVYAGREITITQIQQILASGKPVVAAVSITKKWQDPPHGVIGMGFEATTGSQAVLLVGYTEDGYFIFRNNWGPTWGDQGYGYLSNPYLASNLISVMTIDGLDIQRPQAEASLETYSMRVDGYLAPRDQYSARLSLVLNEQAVSGPEITGVSYSIYSPEQDPETDASAHILRIAQGDSSQSGFPAVVKNLPYRSVYVCVWVYRRGTSESASQCSLVQDMIRWSSQVSASDGFDPKRPSRSKDR